MAGMRASELLRAGLLDGVRIALASARAGDPFAEALGEACTELSGALVECPLGSSEEALAEILRGAGPLDTLVLDAGSGFATVAANEAAGGRAALGDCLALSWELTRALASLAFIEPARAGRIVLIAPPDDLGDVELASYARAARAGLENLARTLSIEWARHSVTAVAIAPAEQSPPQELAALCAFLASPAGAYFSGCVLTLGARGALLAVPGVGEAAAADY
jgi:NAD(P)-dependent dehydrogenase (short-subunit alcohol dehydrogenase family)